MTDQGPQTAFAEQLHSEKYRSKGESFREAMSRIAGALTDGDDYKPFRELLLDMRFLPAGRVQASAGATRKTTCFNCFVAPEFDDSFVDGENSIMAVAAKAATTMRMGGGIGYNFSGLRPRGALIKKLQSKSSGPISFMEIFDAVGRATSSAGHRRGAQMSVLRVDHPDIEEFIHAKQNTTRLTGFNMSIGITDEFMRAVESGSNFELRFEGQIHKEVDAPALWEMIMRSTWDWAEPGVIFLDTINNFNNLWYCEKITTCNPCSEQSLPPNGACLLGSFNLVKYVTGTVLCSFDWEQFRKDIRLATRCMDRVTDVSLYPLPEQKAEALSKRRMGLGVTGLANAIESMGHSYGSPGFVDVQGKILDTLRDESYAASVELARERGAFPLYAPEYLQSKFIATLPAELQKDIAKHGIRNSHLTSIAPTGTISMAADNVSSGIEPVFSLKAKRLVNMATGPQEVMVEDFALKTWGVSGKECADVTVQEHVDVLCAAASRVDSAVSKTCNVPASTNWADFKNIYVQAWQRGAKGCTTYQVGGKRGAILEAAPDEACAYDPATGTRSCE